MFNTLKSLVFCSLNRNFVSMKNSFVRRLCKWSAVTLGSLAALVAVAALLLNSHFVQGRLARLATDLLSERLGTRVSLEDTDIHLLRGSIVLQGVSVDDQQGQPLLQIGEIAVKAPIRPMFHREFDIRRVAISDLRAQVVLPTDSTETNYQFIVDSLTSKKPTKNEKASLELDVKQLSLERIEVSIGEKRVGLESLRVKYDKHEQVSGQIEGLYGEWKGKTRRGPMDCRAYVGMLKLKAMADKLQMAINDARFSTDNHLPRRNVVKPKRGAFDTGHLDMVAKMRLSVSSLSKDSISLLVENLAVRDTATGFDLHDLSFAVQANHRVAHVSDFKLHQGSTELSFASADIQLPSKDDATLRYATSTISATVFLKDIARPFTPVLRTFVMPLSLNARLEGEGDKMRFHDVHVWTTDKALDIRAAGGIEHLRDKQQRLVHFDITPMRTTGHKAMKIIDQLAIKKFMMKQLEALGHISFRGRMDIRRKVEHFLGAVQTDVGALGLDLTIDGMDKRVRGSVQTDSLKLGQVINMPAIGKVGCTADFQFDISKERTRRMRKRVGGKLPMGSVTAHVSQASYKKIKVSDLDANITSNGAMAVGNIAVRGKRADLLCTFSFTNTDSIHKMKIKPGVSFHKLSDERRQAKQEKTEARKQAREEKQTERAIRAEMSRLERQQAKAEKAQRKATSADSATQNLSRRQLRRERRQKAQSGEADE